MPPQTPKSWNGVRDATKHGAVCPQYEIFQQKYINGSEDCLFLNVYTPNSKPKLLYPVVFYIHGGGFRSGSSDSSFYGPDFFIEKNVIVVTINYRLDALGFLCFENELVPGNMGMKDQVAALKWVNKNIKKFGGDPKNITIMGQSAGGASVALHLISPMSKGLFQRAISMSGVPTAAFTVDYQPRLRAFKLGNILGMETRNDTELLEFLQSVPAMSLVNVDVALLGSEVLSSDIIFKNYYFVPVTERHSGGDHFLTVDPLKAFANGDIHDVDVMFGSTNEEAVVGAQQFADFIIEKFARYDELFVPRQILYNCKPDIVLNTSHLIRQYYFGNDNTLADNITTFVNFSGQTYVALAVHRMFSLLPPCCNCNRYSYVFSSFSSRNYYGKVGVPFGIYGASHLDDLLYLFQANALNMTIDINSEEYELVRLTSTLFSNFIKYGNPTPRAIRGVVWPKYVNTKKRYVNIANNTLIIGRNYLQNSINFFKKIYDIAGINF